MKDNEKVCNGVSPGLVNSDNEEEDSGGLSVLEEDE